MTLRQQIVTEIMSLVRQQPKQLPKPSIDELERILNSESTDAVHIEADGTVSITPTVTTVGAVADKVVALVDGDMERLRAALKFIGDLAEEEMPHAKVGTGAEIVLRHIIRRVHEVMPED